MRRGIIGSIFNSFFENVNRILGFSLTSEQLTVKNLGIRVRGSEFERRVVDFKGFVDAISSNEQLRVHFCDSYVLGMFRIERCKLG